MASGQLFNGSIMCSLVYENNWLFSHTVPTAKLPTHGHMPYAIWWTCLTTEHPTHLGSSPQRNTLLTMDLPHRRTPYSPWIFPTAEHPTHRGPASPRNTLLTMDMPHRGTPYLPWTCPMGQKTDRAVFFYFHEHPNIFTKVVVNAKIDLL